MTHQKKKSEIEETSSEKLTQSSTNREPGSSLITQKMKTLEELLLDTIQANAPNRVLKKKRVARGVEVITSEEVKCRMVAEKTCKKSNTVLEEIATSSKDDNSNSICKCGFRHYIKKKDWIQCVTCTQWVCGTCNKENLEEAEIVAAANIERRNVSDPAQLSNAEFIKVFGVNKDIVTYLVDALH
ncbi:hypothetical protein FQA39_LY14974 [Lamprigera yunnana]|nr:hypothetical protein FQA39_LY14974 [Lamprigera yunnana]